MRWPCATQQQAVQLGPVVTGQSNGAMRGDSVVLGSRSVGGGEVENRYGYCDGLIASQGRQLGKLEGDVKSVLLIQTGLRWTYSNRRQVSGGARQSLSNECRPETGS
jgi:hypothetical protein